ARHSSPGLCTGDRCGRARWRSRGSRDKSGSNESLSECLVCRGGGGVGMLTHAKGNFGRKRSTPYIAQLANWGAPLREERVRRAEVFKTKSADGVSLMGVVSGNPNGAPILFIHGFSQCHLAWRRQMTDPELTAHFRLVAYDMRGH